MPAIIGSFARHSTHRFTPSVQRCYRGVLTACCVAAAVTACGSSATVSPSTGATTAAAAATTAPVATVPPAATAAAAAGQCPAAATIGSALGTTLPNPTTITTGAKLPAGATGVVCNYLTTSLDVLVELINNLSQSYISQGEQALSSHSSVKFSPVSGVGDQAVSYSYSLGPAGTAEGVLAVKGSTFVAVSATRTRATLSQVEALVSQLLG